ncbi:MAG TPA: pseudouridine synthase [Candidatus Saccharimonadales bacterium]|nr:pseudouridine synthase [Candidatus Saccharimonadales bacterium]
MSEVRLNKFIAGSSQLSRRSADAAIEQGRVFVNDRKATAGMHVKPGDTVFLDGEALTAPLQSHTILLNKPEGYVVSRNGQGSRTVFSLLPEKYQHLQPVGRLDKHSSGLLLLTSDGELTQTLTHPKYQKTKIYEVALDRPLAPLHHQMITQIGVNLHDGPSKLGLERITEASNTDWLVLMHEGRNRQIRRTFNALGYNVTRLHRTVFGPYKLPYDLASGSFVEMSPLAS